VSCWHCLNKKALFGQGCSFVDLSLLASALLAQQTLFWTLDKRLNAIAVELGLAHLHT